MLNDEKRRPHVRQPDVASDPAAQMLARRNDEGVSVNESSVCVHCLYDDDALAASYEHWENAEDVTAPESMDDTLYPADNPDGRCNGCGATLGDLT